MKLFLKRTYTYMQKILNDVVSYWSLRITPVQHIDYLCLTLSRLNFANYRYVDAEHTQTE